jgi:hypothetical protein
MKYKQPKLICSNCGFLGCNKCDNRPTPTITIKELSRIISESRKSVLKHSLPGTESYVANNCFNVLRDRLELRRRGRK